jgi:actin-related protein
MAIVLPPALPLPLLSTILDSLFNNFQPPTISLMSAPVLATVAAGLRAALVVDIGWTETIVTAIYEYREVLCRRTVRASKRLSLEMLKVLENAVSPLPASDDRSGRKPHDSPSSNIISFEEVEDVVTRLSWCKPSKAVKRTTAPTGLPSVREEEEEIEGPMKDLSISEQESDIVSIPLTSTAPPMTLQLPFSTLAMPCEAAFFATGFSRYDLDDEESPLHEIVYSTLLHTPVEVRSVCMSRIVFTGGASVIPGLKARIIDDVQGLIETRGWDIVRGAAVARLRTNPKLHNSRSRKANDGPSEVAREPVFDVQNDRISNLPVALEDQEPDTIGDQIRREGRKAAHPSVQGTLRAVESMGSWTGASLLTHLKVPAVALVEREQWLQHGAAGASKQGEAVVLKQRQSMGPAGLRTGNIEQTTWTLGPWG